MLSSVSCWHPAFVCSASLSQSAVVTACHLWVNPAEEGESPCECRDALRGTCISWTNVLWKKKKISNHFAYKMTSCADAAPGSALYTSHPMITFTKTNICSSFLSTAYLKTISCLWPTSLSFLLLLFNFLFTDFDLLVVDKFCCILKQVILSEWIIVQIPVPLPGAHSYVSLIYLKRRKEQHVVDTGGLLPRKAAGTCWSSFQPPGGRGSAVDWLLALLLCLHSISVTIHLLRRLVF